MLVHLPVLALTFVAAIDGDLASCAAAQFRILEAFCTYFTYVVLDAASRRFLAYLFLPLVLVRFTCRFRTRGCIDANKRLQLFVLGEYR